MPPHRRLFLSPEPFAADRTTCEGETARRLAGVDVQVARDGAVKFGDYAVPGSRRNAMLLNFEGGGADIPTYSLADIAAAAQISCIDYLGDVPWDQHEGARDWYQRVKSRPSLRPILADHIPGAPPPSQALLQPYSSSSTPSSEMSAGSATVGRFGLARMPPRGTLAH